MKFVAMFFFSTMVQFFYWKSGLSSLNLNESENKATKRIEAKTTGKEFLKNERIRTRGKEENNESYDLLELKERILATFSLS